MPTERLYWNDAYLRQFEARVVAFTEYAGKPAVTLDATAFYPEGGGQPADRGTLGGVSVIDVQERAGEIYHVLGLGEAPLAAELTPGGRVSGEIDWQRRFDYMQQHSGQHILSGGFWRLCQGETVSWHLGEEYTSVDIQVPTLSPEQAAEVEYAANEILWNDIGIEAHIYAPDQVAALGLRRGPKVESDIRIVSIGDWDAIGCGGTHVLSAGRVGGIGIRRWETRGNVTRVEFLCGQRALDDYRRKTRALTAIGQMLAAPLDGLEAATGQMLQTQAALRENLEKATQRPAGPRGQRSAGRQRAQRQRAPGRLRGAGGPRGRRSAHPGGAHRRRRRHRPAGRDQPGRGPRQPGLHLRQKPAAGPEQSAATGAAAAWRARRRPEVCRAGRRPQRRGPAPRAGRSACCAAGAGGLRFRGDKTRACDKNGANRLRKSRKRWGFS